LSDTATAEAVINYGNYLPYLNGVGSFSGTRSEGQANINGAGFGQVHQDEQTTIYKLLVDAPTKLGPFGKVGITVGRIPIQLTPYTLKLTDNDSYFYNSKTDLGDIPVDGGKIALHVGPIGVTAFAAKVDPIKYVSNLNGQIAGDNQYGLYAGAAYSPFAPTRGFAKGFQGGGLGNFGRPTGSSIDPAVNGAMAIEQLGGGRATIGVAKYGTLGATFVALGGNTGIATAGDIPVGFSDPNFRAVFNKVYVYGVDFNGLISGIGVNASGTKSDTYQGSDKRTDKGDGQWDVNLAYAVKALKVKGGYREIGSLFAAPGYWGRLGSWTNPTDIKGPYFNLSYGLGKNVSLEGSGEFDKGADTDDAAGTGGLTSSDKITNYKFGVKYGLTSVSNIDLGAEYTQYESANFGGGKPEETFFNIGYGYSFNPATSFKLLYQIVSYADKGTGFDTINGNGGVAAAQVSVKF